MESIDRAGREINQGMEDVKRTGAQAADEMRDTGRRLRHGLKDDIGRLLDELDQILRSDGAAGDVHALRARLEDRIANARTALDNASDTATGMVYEAIDCAEEYVHTRPWHALGTVAGVAFLLGMIVARR